MNNEFVSKVQTAGASMNSSTILLIIGTILFVIVGIAYYYFYLTPYAKASNRANCDPASAAAEDDNSVTGEEAELLFFYADWCPHSKTSKPIWEELKLDFQNKLVNGYVIIFTEINCTNENAEVSKLIDRYNVEGFPTIKLLKDGQIIEYDAKPNKENLTQFLNTVLK
jgi:thiol-disulfide isomerase/thioredoxin